MKKKIIIRFGQLVPFVALALLVALVIARANPYTTVPTRDNGSYLYFGRLILKGGRPYIDAWDSKPPAIFYINALGLLIGRETRWGVWFLEFVFLFSAACIGYNLLRKYLQLGSAIFGMIFWVWGLDKVFWKGNTVEEYSLLFSMTAIFLFWLGNQNPKKRIYDFAIGMMTVFSFLFRANNIGMGIAIAISWIIIGVYQRQYLLMVKRLGIMLTGGIAILFFVAMFLWQQGILVDAWNASILYNISYITNRASILSSIIPGFQYLGMVTWTSLLGYIASVAFVIRRLKTGAVYPFMWLTIILWPVEILLSSLSGRGYMHYFINWLPSVAILCGFLYEEMAPMVFSQKFISFLNTEKIPMTAIVLFAMVLGYSRVNDYYHAFYTLLFDRKYGVEEINPVSRYIRRNTNPDDTVLDWVQSGINYMSQREAPTAYLWYPGYIPSQITRKMEDGFYQDISSHPPEIIVDAYLVAPDVILSLDPAIRQQQLDSGKGLFAGKAENVDLVLAFIQEHYKVETVIEGFTVYRLLKP